MSKQVKDHRNVILVQPAYNPPVQQETRTSKQVERSLVAAWREKRVGALDPAFWDYVGSKCGKGRVEVGGDKTDQKHIWDDWA